MNYPATNSTRYQRAPANKVSVLRSLRALVPRRESSFADALRIAEIQATRLAGLLGADGEGITEYHLARLPRLRIVYDDLPVSGMSHWNGETWIISIARTESLARQRFTMLHEFKHILDHGHTSRLYRGDQKRPGEEQAEAAADYFAGCALVSRRSLKSAWGNGIQRIADLADHFGVSQPAIRVRLAQTGLDLASDTDQQSRCRRTQRSKPANHDHGRYYRRSTA